MIECPAGVVKYFRQYFSIPVHTGDVADTFGARLRRARYQHMARIGRMLSQAEIARALGVNQSSVSAWEADAAEPSLAMIAQLGVLLGVPPGWLAFGPANETGAAPAAPVVTSQVPERPYIDPGAVRLEDTDEQPVRKRRRR